MKNGDEITLRMQEARQRLLKTWLIWGVAPLMVIALFTLAISASGAGAGAPGARRLDQAFQAVFAFAAFLFLAGFWLDGRWTDAQRIARRLQAAAGVTLPFPAGKQAAEAARQALAAQAPVGFVSIYNSATALAAIGIAIAVSALLASVAGLGLRSGMILMVLAAAYQVFVFSRHPYYLELMRLALNGELVMHEKVGTAQD